MNTNAYENLRVTGYERGCESAHSRGIWPNEARDFLDGMSAEESGVECPSPLSGEWSGESMTELLGSMAGDDDAAAAYEAGFEQGWEDTMTAKCHDLLL